MEPDLEAAREKYRPREIRFLLIAGAPPRASTGRFFYLEDVPGDSLFLETMKALYPGGYTTAKEVRRRKGEFLARFMADGFYLIDASEEPMASPVRTRKAAQLSEHLPGLIERVARLCAKDTRIILISDTVYHACRAELVAKGFSSHQPRPHRVSRLGTPAQASE